MTSPQRQDQGRGAYEQRDVDVRSTGLAILGGALLVAITALVMSGAFHYLAGNRRQQQAGLPQRFTNNAQLPPEPRLQVDPPAELAELREYEEDRLERYRWVDRDKGIVAIPIERAMEMLTRQHSQQDDGGKP